MTPPVLGRRAAMAGALGLAAMAPAAAAGPAFPLRVAATGRHLEDSAGVPFLLHGDSAWSLFAQLRIEEAEAYLADRRDRGFTTLLVSLIEHQFADRAPANAYGDAPFLTPGDFGTPNEAYFAHAERVLQRAEALGFLVLLTPAYLGARGGPEGWYEAMRAAGPARLRRYGSYVGRRFGRFRNLLWVHGGDFSPPDRSVVRAVAEGIRAQDTRSLNTAHCGTEVSAVEYWAGEPWLQVNTLYTYRPVAPAALAEYRQSPHLPCFLIESAYEHEQHSTPPRLRSQAWQAMLSGACGQVFGCHPIWHFGAPGMPPAPTGWREALGGAGSVSMQHLGTFFRGLPWWRLVPDAEARFMRGDPGTGHDQAVAARAADGSFAVAYLPRGQEAVLDLAQLSGRGAAGRWYDPTNGRFAPATLAPGPDRALHRVRPPPRNGAGFQDWVLLVQADV